jgi:hypothetical protein
MGQTRAALFPPADSRFLMRPGGALTWQKLVLECASWFCSNTHFLHFRSIFTFRYSPTSLPALARHFRSFFLITPNFASPSRTVPECSALINFFPKHTMNRTATRLAVHFCAFQSLDLSPTLLPSWTLHVNDIQRQNPSGNSSLSPIDHQNFLRERDS